MKCDVCGSELRERKRLSGAKEGMRYWVCSRYPECTFRKGYAEQGKKATWKYTLEGGNFGLKKMD